MPYDNKNTSFISPENVRILQDNGYGDLLSRINPVPQYPDDVIVPDQLSQDPALITQQNRLEAIKKAQQVLAKNPKFQDTGMGNVKTPTEDEITTAGLENKANKQMLAQMRPEDMQKAEQASAQSSLLANAQKKMDAGLPMSQEESIAWNTAQNNPVSDQSTIDTSGQSTAQGGFGIGLGNSDADVKRLMADYKKLGQAQADQSLAEAKHLEAVYNHTDQWIKQKEERDLEDQSQFNLKMGEINQKINYFHESPANVGQLFHSMDTGNKLLAGIAMFLGAAPNSTTSNSAVDAMKAAVDADIRKQSQDIENSQGAFKDFYQITKDKRAAEHATYLAYLGNADIKLKQIAASTNSPIVQQQAAIMGHNLELMADQHKEALAMSLMAASGKDKSRETYVPAFGDYAATKEDAALLKEKTGAFYNARSNLEELKTLTSKPMAYLTPSERARASTLIPVIIGELRKPIVGGGQFSDQERKFLEEAISNPVALMSLRSSSKLKIETLIKAMDKNIDGLGIAYGLRVKPKISEIKE